MMEILAQLFNFLAEPVATAVCTVIVMKKDFERIKSDLKKIKSSCILFNRSSEDKKWKIYPKS